MTLATAVEDLDRRIKSTGQIRIRYCRRSFPPLMKFKLMRLISWVEKRLASGEMELLNEVTIDIDGKWENFRFPAPEIR